MIIIGPARLEFDRLSVYHSMSKVLLVLERLFPPFYMTRFGLPFHMTQLGATRFNLFDLYHTEDDRGEKQLYAIYDDLPLHLGMEVDVA